MNLKQTLVLTWKSRRSPKGQVLTLVQPQRDPDLKIQAMMKSSNCQRKLGMKVTEATVNPTVSHSGKEVLSLATLGGLVADVEEVIISTTTTMMTNTMINPLGVVVAAEEASSSIPIPILMSLEVGGGVAPHPHLEENFRLEVMIGVLLNRKLDHRWTKNAWIK